MPETGQPLDDAPPVRLAMIGGGPGAFIGPVHRMAAELDGRIELVAGCFSRDPGKSRAAGEAWGIAADRVYADHAALIAGEASRADGAELLSIVTPTATHYPIARAALEAGLHVVCDKPATATLDEARALAKIVASAGRLFAVTFTYTGYPLIREAAALVANGAIGGVRKVAVEYSQGWLARPVEREGNKQAAWRLDPKQAGPGGCIGDIGVHAFNLAEFVSGRQVAELCAELSRIVAGRELDDDCNVLLRFDNRAPGVLHASQVASGDLNELRIRVWGESGGIDWSHQASEQLIVKRSGEPSRVLHAGESYVGATGRAGARLPAGHPQGFIEAFANIYRDVAVAIRTRTSPDLVPGIEQAVRSMTFIECALASSQRRAWIGLQA